MRKRELYIHPIILIVLYCLLVIVGEESGGFYIKYLVIGFFNGALFGLLGIGGILIFYVAMLLPASVRRLPYYLMGAAAMVVSLLVFFLTDKERYNYSTFRQVLPVAVLTLFSLLVIIFVTNIVVQLLRKGNSPD